MKASSTRRHARTIFKRSDLVVLELQFLDYLPAWVTAVKVDATFVVFDCGNYVRISIRLRERQTLFLASLIDIRSCKDAGYGGPWTAFDVFAIADAIKRVPLVESSHLTKRNSTFDELRRSSKRLKRGDLASIDRVCSTIPALHQHLTYSTRQWLRTWTHSRS